MSHKIGQFNHTDESKKKISKNNAKYWLGKKRSTETREKISKIQTGKKRVSHSEETKRKMSESSKGEKCYLWKGGITPEVRKFRNGIEIRLWRESVFARDNWICQKCDQRGGKLNAHHIQNFSEYKELRTSIENGITFCEKCHKKFHKKYGKKSNNIEQINEFLKFRYD